MLSVVGVLHDFIFVQCDVVVVVVAVVYRISLIAVVQVDLVVSVIFQ